MWRKTQGNYSPDVLEIHEDENLVYVRKNIQKVVVEDAELFEYDENIMSVEDWNTYREVFENTSNVEKNNALIEYVAIMTDVELPEV